MTIQELREKRSKAWDTARDFLDSKRNESGLLSEEDSKTYDAMEQQIVAYGKEIQRLERQAQIEAEMNKPTSTPIQNKPTAITQVNIESLYNYGVGDFPRKTAEPFDEEADKYEIAHELCK